MLNANFTRKLTDVCREPGVRFKKLDVYVPRTWNIQLDDILEEVIKRASKGFSFLEYKHFLQPIVAEELRKRGFVLEPREGSIMIQW